MKRIIQLFITLSMIGLCCNPIMVSALDGYNYDFESGSGFIYKITDNEISIVQYSCSPEGINGDVIPDKINGYPITTIGYRSFHLVEMLESITLPETLVTIESEAFAGCKMLTSIVIPRSVEEIGSCALGYDFIATQVEVGNKYSNFTIYGYNGTVAETYANENGFTFIALDEPISTIMTHTTQITSTSTTATTTTISSDNSESTNISTNVSTTTATSDIQIITTQTSLPSSTIGKSGTTSKQTTTTTQNVNPASNGNANNSKGSSSSSPKTGDSFPIVSVLTAIGISVLSTVLFMKKRK